MDASKIGSSHVQVVRLEALLHRMKMETVGSVDAVVAEVGEAGATAHAHRSASPDSSAAERRGVTGGIAANEEAEREAAVIKGSATSYLGGPAQQVGSF